VSTKAGFSAPSLIPERASCLGSFGKTPCHPRRKQLNKKMPFQPYHGSFLNTIKEYIRGYGFAR
jgi:hypothetical protein